MSRYSDESVDAVTSNGVLNLAPDRASHAPRNPVSSSPAGGCSSADIARQASHGQTQAGSAALGRVHRRRGRRRQTYPQDAARRISFPTSGRRPPSTTSPRIRIPRHASRWPVTSAPRSPSARAARIAFKAVRAPADPPSRRADAVQRARPAPPGIAGVAASAACFGVPGIGLGGPYSRRSGPPPWVPSRARSTFGLRRVDPVSMLVAGAPDARGRTRPVLTQAAGGRLCPSPVPARLALVGIVPAISRWPNAGVLGATRGRQPCGACSGRPAPNEVPRKIRRREAACARRTAAARDAWRRRRAFAAVGRGVLRMYKSVDAFVPRRTRPRSRASASACKASRLRGRAQRVPGPINGCKGKGFPPRRVEGVRGPGRRAAQRGSPPIRRSKAA